MKYLIRNKNWNIVEDYNIDKLLYLLIDRPAYVSTHKSFFWMKDKEDHRDYDLPAIVWNDNALVWYFNGIESRINNKDTILS